MFIYLSNILYHGLSAALQPFYLAGSFIQRFICDTETCVRQEADMKQLFLASAVSSPGELMHVHAYKTICGIYNGKISKLVLTHPQTAM